jgi:hypothetical protein
VYQEIFGLQEGSMGDRSRERQLFRSPCCDEIIDLGPVPSFPAASLRELDRRDFLRALGGSAAALAAAGLTAHGVPILAAEESKPQHAESFVEHLYFSLTSEQRKEICFPFEHEQGKVVRNNWHIVPQKIGEFFNSDQQELIRLILKGVTSEDGYERFQKSMKDDDGGLANYSCAIFGSPLESRCQFVLTGRHVTLRADGNAVANTVFGGPIFYGHAVKFDEDPGHPGNVWWHQGQLANKLFEALDGKQREKALLKESPPDTQNSILIRGDAVELPGLGGEEMGPDQKELLQQTMKSLLAMFRESDVDEAIAAIKKNGGFDKVKINFYQDEDIGADGVWDRWRVEGPAFVWYFRGSPHVHTWVNIQHQYPKTV